MTRPRRLVLFLAGALVVGPAPALQVQGQDIQLDARELALLPLCAHGSGCTIVHRDLLTKGLTEALAKAHADGLAACKGGT